MARNRHALTLLAGCALLAWPAAAQPVPPDAGWVPRPVAVLRGLDKVSAVATTLVIPAGTTVSFGSLSITVRSCDVRPPDQPGDATAFIDVVDSRSGAPPFHGWIFANEPSIDIFQHPVYDLRLSGCRE